MAGSDNLRAFHDFKRSALNQSIVIDVRLVDEGRRGIRLAARKHRLRGPIYKRHPKVLTTLNLQVGTVFSGDQRHRLSTTAFRVCSELEMDFYAVIDAHMRANV